ncbi:MAG TPA: 5-formyltetrahydrofolate cyclo-ligase [Cyclobacteriaceae bacterium]
MNKAALRKIYIDVRKKLAPEQCAHFNLQLYHLFFLYADLSFIKTLHTYLPLEKNNEPDTWAIIDRIRREFPHIRISVPKVNPKTNELENFYFEGLHQIEVNTWGISEPKQGVPTPTEKIDLVLVPLLTFDQKGDRIGYGKGYYDRFFSQCRPDCKKVGLSFFDPVELISDLNEHDVKLNACVTPKQVYHFE